MRARTLMLLVVGMVLAGATGAFAQEDTITGLRLEGVVDPIIASYIKDNLEAADESTSRAVLLTIDTPGGLDSSMRDVVKAILNSSTPVICYVSPEGARAASAGAFILIACDVAAMAPGTNVGAATPVGISGIVERRKATNDAAAYIRSLAEDKGRNADWAEQAVREAASVSAEEALDLDVIDLIAEDRSELFSRVDGTTVEKNGTSVAIDLDDATFVEKDLGLGLELIHSLLSPDLAFLLFYLGLGLIIVEVLHPGLSVPGILGVLSLVASFVGLGMLPVQLIGVVLLLASAGLMLLELKNPGFGAAGVSAAITLVLGGLLLFDRAVPGAAVSPVVIAPVALVMLAFVAFVAPSVLRARRLPVQSGIDRLIGQEGVAVTDISPEGSAHVAGELWSVETVGAEIRKGDRLKVVDSEGIRLKVKPFDKSEETEPVESLGGQA